MFTHYKVITTTDLFDDDDLDERICNLINLPSLNSSRVEAKAIMQSISMHPPLGYKPREVILCLTLKLLIDSRADPLVKYAFGMIRGLYKEYLISKTPRQPKPPRRSYRNSTQINSENTEITEFGEFLKQTSAKNLFCRSQSRPESPTDFRKSWETSKSSIRNENLTRQTYRSLFKIFYKFLAKHFAKLRDAVNLKSVQKKIIKNFVNSVSVLSYRQAFNKVLRFVTLHSLMGKNENKSDVSQGSAFNASKMNDNGKDLQSFNRNNGNKSSFVKSASMTQESHSRSPSFECRDKEIWRKRHPLRHHSPSPVETRPSLFINLNFSESNSPRNPFVETPDLRGGPRRNTVGVLKKFDTFGTVDSNDKLEDPSQSISKESQDSPKVKTPMSRKQKPLRSGRSEPAKPIKKPLELTPDVKKKLEKMTRNIGNNLKTAKAKGLIKLNQAVQDEKAQRRKGAAGVLSDILGFRTKCLEKRNKKDAFESIKKEAKNKPFQLSPKVEMKKPPKKPILRSGNQRKDEAPALERPVSTQSTLDGSVKSTHVESSDPPTPPTQSARPKKFLKLFDWVKTRNLKNKLLGFIKITEHSGNIKNHQKSLRSIFRVLEAKRFSRVCRIFHNIKRYSTQRSHLLQKKYIIFAQKLSKIFSYSLKSRTLPAFSKLTTFISYPKAGRRLLKALESIETRAKLAVKPLVWYRISSYIKKCQCDNKVRSVKLDYLTRKVYIRKLAYAFV